MRTGPAGRRRPLLKTAPAPRRSSRAPPVVFPRAAWVSPTASCASPRQSVRSPSGPDFQASSKTSCAWNGFPASNSACASVTVSSGLRTTPSGCRSTPSAPCRQRPSQSVPGPGVPRPPVVSDPARCSADLRMLR